MWKMWTKWSKPLVYCTITCETTEINATNAILNPDRQDYLGANGAILNLQDLPGYRSAIEAQQIREKFKLYFNSPAGQLNWQEDYLPGNR